MSYMEVIGIFKDQKNEPFTIAEYQNAHGAWPVVWNCMAMRYLDVGRHDYGEVLTELWALQHDLSVPAHHRAVLILTFDRALVIKKNYSRIADDLGKFTEDFQGGGEIRAEFVCHLWTIWAMFKGEVEKAAISYDVPDFIGFAQSVAENQWMRYDEDDNYIPIDFSTTYEVYELLEGNELKVKGVQDAKD